MKKTILIAVICTLASCKKDERENPQPQIDFSAWANTGNTIFNDGGVPVIDTMITNVTVNEQWK